MEKNYELPATLKFSVWDIENRVLEFTNVDDVISWATEQHKAWQIRQKPRDDVLKTCGITNLMCMVGYLIRLNN